MTVAKTLAPISSIAGMVSKETRKMHYRSIHSDVMLPKNANKQRQMSTPTSSMTSSSLGGYSGLTKLKMLSQKLDILKSRDASFLQLVQEIRLIENKIFKVIDESTDDVESSGHSSTQSFSSSLSLEFRSSIFEHDNENDGPVKSTTV